jgi:hypothetical protein
LDFFYNPGCPGQLTRTTTNPRTHWILCKPSRLVRHHGGDRRAHWDLNPGCRGKETLPRPLGHKPRCKYLDVLPTLEVTCLVTLIVISRSLGCVFGALIILEIILYFLYKAYHVQVGPSIKRTILLFLKFIWYLCLGDSGLKSHFML